MCKLFRFKDLNANNDVFETVFNAEQIIEIVPDVQDKDGFAIIITFNGGSVEKKSDPLNQEIFYFNTKEQRDKALEGLYALTGSVTEI